MEELDKRIVAYIKKHHVLTLATMGKEDVWVSQAFYAYDEALNAFVFSSDEGSLHIRQAMEKREVGVSIVTETRIVGKVQGVQIRGVLVETEGEVYNQAKKRYIKRFPYAVAGLKKLYLVYVKYVKMTDNALGFGKKLYYGGE